MFVTSCLLLFCVSSSSVNEHSPYTSGSCTETASTSLTGKQAEASDISDLRTCAQHAADLSLVSGSVSSNFVSFGTSERGEASCRMFADCGCVMGGQCDSSGGSYLSAAVSSLIKPVTSNKTVKTKAGNFQVTTSGTTQITDPLATETSECSDSFLDLMKTFQSKCEFARTTAYKRFVALCVVCVSLFVVVLGFAIAHHLEIKASQN
jgi:hypothetical protein